MPELPEVETIAHELCSEIKGDIISSVKIFRNNPIIQGDIEKFKLELIGKKIFDVYRRAKYLIFHLKPRCFLISHLRMTGKFIVSQYLSEPSKYNRVWFILKSGRLMIFDDVRCFGTLEIQKKLNDSNSIKKLGIEPLSKEMDTEFFFKKLSNSKREIKSVLLDQKIVAGLGNIYVSEILFRSGIHPESSVCKFRKKDWVKIVNFTREVLEEAIANNGTTISDFRRVDDKTGQFQKFLNVYGKKNEPCTKCGTPIQRIVQQQRSTFFCLECQKFKT
tara:strand:+ start:3328 stop:4155 length:828 start_codon:yes stop_codon:yes gene_type:complete